AAGPGDDYASITVTYSVASTPTKVQLLFGGHLAPSVGPRGWGANVGASFINGGPYHIRLDSVDSSSLGNRDNQIMSGAILPIGTATQTALHETNSLGAAPRAALARRRCHPGQHRPPDLGLGRRLRDRLRRGDTRERHGLGRPQVVPEPRQLHE